jgi:hypothetical protein
LKCDDSFGTYCDYECVENDLQAAVNIAGWSKEKQGETTSLRVEKMYIII